MSLTTEVRQIYIRIMLQADERVGVGGVVRFPFNRIIRELVYLRLLLTGAINLPVEELLPAITATIDASLSTWVFPHA